MIRYTCVFRSGVATVMAIILLLNDVVCHDKITANVNRMEQMSANDSVQLQQQQQNLSQPQSADLSGKSNIDQRNIYVGRDRFDNDKIVFDRYMFSTAPAPNKQTVADRFMLTSSSSLLSPSPLPSLSSLPNNDASIKTNETNQEYVSKSNGEYKFTLTVRDGIRRIESGEFEERNGQKVFIIRGFFEHISKEGEIKITAYIFDHTGYHEIPFMLEGQAVADFRPDQETDCDISKGEYCIDRKLLSLMVG